MHHGPPNFRKPLAFNALKQGIEAITFAKIEFFSIPDNSI
jgi:hypothetical protein